MSDKLKALNTIGIWIAVLCVVGYLFFKPTNTLNKETVTQLTKVVDNLAVASENMTKLANAQREWFDDLKQQAADGELLRNKNYGNLYEQYGYGNSQGAGMSLNELYNSNNRVQPQTNDLGSGHVRPVQDGNSKTGAVQKPAGEPKGQSH